MRKHCRLDIKKILGIIFTSMGIGMLLVLLVPWWGYILAFGLVITGIFLLIIC